MIPSSLDVVEKGLSRVLDQFKDKPNVTTILSAFLNQTQSLEDTTLDMMNATKLPYAEGVQLDRLGEIFGESRSGRGDTEYRAAIYARLSVLTTKGGSDNILSVVKNICDPAHAVIRENFYSTIYEEQGDVYSTPPCNPEDSFNWTVYRLTPQAVVNGLTYSFDLVNDGATIPISFTYSSGGMDAVLAGIANDINTGGASGIIKATIRQVPAANIHEIIVTAKGTPLLSDVFQPYTLNNFLNLNSTTSFPFVTFDETSKWSKPCANIIVEVTAKNNNFQTIPDAIVGAVQAATAAGVKASTIMMKKDYYMQSLLEKTLLTAEELVSVNGTDLLAYATPSLPNNPVGNIIAKSYVTNADALATNRTRLREIRKQLPQPLVTYSDESGYSIYLNSSDFLLNTDRISIKKSLANTQYFAPNQVIKFQSGDINVIKSVGEATINGEEYYQLIFVVPNDFIVAEAFATVFSADVEQWSVSNKRYDSVLVQDQNGEYTLSMALNGETFDGNTITEEKIGILMEIRHG